MAADPSDARSGAQRDRAWRDELRARVAHELETLALPELVAYGAIPCRSPAFDPDWAARGELVAAARLLAGAVGRRGLRAATAEVVELAGRTPALVVEVPATDASSAGTTTLCYGHLDKQPPLGAWRAGLDPYRPVRQGDLLYGRGMADDGYATFAVLAALSALEGSGAGHGRVVLLVEASEESGSPDLEAHLDALAPRLGDVGLVVCLDSGGPSYDRLWVTSSLRGNLVLTLTVEVLTEGVHSGTAGGAVPSSFRLARQLLSRLEDESTGDLRVPELLATVPAHRRAEIAAVAAELGEAAAGSFPTVPGLRLEGGDVAERIERLTWRPALEVTGAAGLPSPEAGGNVLRPATTLKVSLRLPPTCDADAACAAVEAALRRDPPAGARVSLEHETPAQGWDAPPLAPVLAETLEAASLAHFGAPAAALGLGGSIPFLATLGTRWPAAQLLATGVLGPNSNAHGPNEALHLPATTALTACLAEVLAAAGGRPPGHA